MCKNSLNTCFGSIHFQRYLWGIQDRFGKAWFPASVNCECWRFLGLVSETLMFQKLLEIYFFSYKFLGRKTLQSPFNRIVMLISRRFESRFKTSEMYIPSVLYSKNDWLTLSWRVAATWVTVILCWPKLLEGPFKISLSNSFLLFLASSTHSLQTDLSPLAHY